MIVFCLFCSFLIFLLFFLVLWFKFSTLFFYFLSGFCCSPFAPILRVHKALIRGFTPPLSQCAVYQAFRFVCRVPQSLKITILGLYIGYKCSFFCKFIQTIFRLFHPLFSPFSPNRAAKGFWEVWGGVWAILSAFSRPRTQANIVP